MQKITKKSMFLPPILWVSTAKARQGAQKFKNTSSYLGKSLECICVLYLKKKMDFTKKLPAKVTYPLRLPLCPQRALASLKTQHLDRQQSYFVVASACLFEIKIGEHMTI